MRFILRQIKTFTFWTLLLIKLASLGSIKLIIDILKTDEDILPLVLWKAKFEGSDIKQKRKDCILTIKAHYNLKQVSEDWPVVLDYELGEMQQLNEKIARYQGKVDLFSELNNLLP